MARTRLSRPERGDSSVLHDVGALPDRVLDRRSVLLAARYEYAAAIAPQGQEASYGSLAYLPFLVASCSSERAAGFWRRFVRRRARHSGLMWLIFALAASVAPLGLIVFRRYIRVPEAGREEAVPSIILNSMNDIPLYRQTVGYDQSRLSLWVGAAILFLVATALYIGRAEGKNQGQQIPLPRLHPGSPQLPN